MLPKRALVAVIVAKRLPRKIVPVVAAVVVWLRSKKFES
jgi:hypothetical protein